MAETAKILAKEKGLTVKVYGKDYLAKENMGAFLAVNRGSEFPPQLIHLMYRPGKPKSKVVLIGKGITFDTGGYSLKPSDGMVAMKMDMGGAAALLGVMRLVRDIAPDIEVHAVIGATDNVINEHAYKPDDILRARNGKTIEVNNTDAEGRLVLADCLSYGQDVLPDYIIDIATLTGACMVGLGLYTIGVMGYNRSLVRDIIAAGESSGEQAAHLPFNKYLRQTLRSDVADIVNVSSDKRMGGAITAGLFLAEFVEKKYRDKWAHLDIAGPAIVSKPWGYHPAGGSGAGTRLLLEWLRRLNNG